MFGFIVHPRDEKDILRSKWLSPLRKISRSNADFVRRVCALPPTVVGEVLFGFSPFRGEIVSIPCLPADVPSLRGRKEILRAAQMLAERGAKVIGLGALTAPATGGGAWLVEHLPSGITVTNGNSYTAAVLQHNVLNAIEALALNRPACIAIVGCTGSVGSVVSRLLVDHDLDLILVGRSVAKVRDTFTGFGARARFSEDLADVAAADVILLLTSASSARLSLSQVRPGVVVIDATEPANVSDEDARTWRHRVRVVRGGRVLIPMYHCTCDFGFENTRETYACLAETYLFAREGICEHSVGTSTPDLAKRLERVAIRHGVCPSFAVRTSVDAGGG